MTYEFKNAHEAARIIAEKIGGKQSGSSGDAPHIILGDEGDADGKVYISIAGDFSKCAVRATVERSTSYWYDKVGWKGIKAIETREEKDYRSVVVKYSSDLDALVEKIKPLVEPLKGRAARRKQADADAEQLRKKQTEARRPFVEALISSGLAADNGGSEQMFAVYKVTAKAEAAKGMPFSLDCKEEHIDVKFSVPYAKAEEVLAALRDKLQEKKP